MKKQMKTFIKALLILLVLILAGSIAMVIYLSQGLDQMASREIPAMDAVLLADGTYPGHFDQGRWRNELVVHVSNGMMERIEIVQTVRFERSEVTEELISRVLSAQSTQVDVVSSATLTSQAYLESIADALRADRHDDSN